MLSRLAAAWAAFVTERCRLVAPAGVWVRAQHSRTRSGRASSLPTLVGEMSIEPVQPGHSEGLELPVEELLRCARPLPPHDVMVIEDLSEEEGAAFLAALEV